MFIPNLFMKGTKLYDILHSLNVYEWNRLNKFMHSPYHNEEKKLVKLYSFLLPHLKSKTIDTLTREAVWKKIYGTQPFTNLKYARLLSDLVKRVESFIALEKMRNTPAAETLYLLDVYNDKKLDAYFSEPFGYALKHIENTPYRDSDFYFHRFQLNAQQNMHLENKQLRSTEKNLQQTIESLDVFYLIEKLRYSAAVLHYKKFLTLKDENIFFAEILSHLAKNPYPGIPVINIRYLIVQTLIEPENEQHFQTLKKQMWMHAKLFPVYTNKEFYAFALNYCIRKINAGQVRYQQEIFALYKEALKTDLLLENGVLSPWDFKNIVTIGLRNKEFLWTENFITTYKTKISKAERSNAYTFNMARYYFAVKKHDKVLSLLQNVEYDDVFYLLDSKTTLLKTYYELDEQNALYSLKESFRILLRRKKIISEQSRINYLNFLRLTMKLFRVDVSNKTKMAKLREEINSAANVADLGWIKEKWAELDV